MGVVFPVALAGCNNDCKGQASGGSVCSREKFTARDLLISGNMGNWTDFFYGVVTIMLHEIGLKNFKAFGAHLQKAPLSKISLIYGPNSGGKSSIIQALLLLKQSRSDDRLAFARAEEPIGRLRPRGEYVDLGGYGALIHKHDTSQSLGISLAYEGQGVSRDRRYASGLFTTQRITSNMSFSSPHPNSQTDFTGLEYKIMHSDRTLFDGKWESSIGHDDDRTIASRLSIGGVDIHPDLIAISDNGFLPYLYVPGLTPEGGRNAVRWDLAKFYFANGMPSTTGRAMRRKSPVSVGKSKFTTLLSTR